MLKSSLFLFFLLISSPTFAGILKGEVIFDRDGKKIPDAKVNSPKVNWDLLKLKENKKLNGIGLVDFGYGGGCTGTLIDAGAIGDEPAYILTNGHCTGGTLMGPHDILINKPAPRGMAMKFNYFIDAGNEIFSVPVKKYSYATMHGTDVAVMELGMTYQGLKKLGFSSYKITSKESEAGTPVELVGVPQSGIKSATRFIRRSDCELLGQVYRLSEGGYSWTGSYRHQCSSIGGSSGSPMLSRDFEHIVAINNTGVNDSALDSQECSLDRPCEVNEDGRVHTLLDHNYAQRVSEIPSCFTAQGVFDLTLEGCKLAH